MELESYVYTFLAQNIKIKNGSFVTTDEIYNNMPKTCELLRHYPPDVLKAIEASEFWKSIGVHFQEYAIIPGISQYYPMSCRCHHSDRIGNVFVDVCFKPIQDNHFVDCDCYHDYTSDSDCNDE